jgi:hypothetical protein
MCHVYDKITCQTILPIWVKDKVHIGQMDVASCNSGNRADGARIDPQSHLFEAAVEAPPPYPHATPTAGWAALMALNN